MSQEKYLRNQIIKLAHDKPEFREILLPLVTAKGKQRKGKPGKSAELAMNEALDLILEATYHLNDILDPYAKLGSGARSLDSILREPSMARAELNAIADRLDKIRKYVAKADQANEKAQAIVRKAIGK